jgi:hypothetical protein
VLASIKATVTAWERETETAKATPNSNRSPNWDDQLRDDATHKPVPSSEINEGQNAEL